MKLSLFADDMILYIGNPEDPTRKLPELINEYSKVSGYKINTQKSLAILYTNNEKTEREIKETIPNPNFFIWNLDLLLPNQTNNGDFLFFICQFHNHVLNGISTYTKA